MILKIFVLLAAIATFISQAQADDIAFIKLGSYGESFGQTKNYYIPRYFKAHWVHTRSICQAYGMEVLSLETEHEANSFLELCRTNAGYFEQWTHIGGITLAGKSLSTWYWVNSGKRVDYHLKFGQGQPDNHGNVEYCLSIGKYPGNAFFFNDINCFGVWELKFICQKTESVNCKVNSECWERLSKNSLK